MERELENKLDQLRRMIEANNSLMLVQALVGKAGTDIMGKGSSFMYELENDINQLKSRAKKLVGDLEDQIFTEANSIPYLIRKITQETEDLHIFHDVNGFHVFAGDLELGHGSDLLEILQKFPFPD